jgi:hypothetical protein
MALAAAHNSPADLPRAGQTSAAAPSVPARNAATARLALPSCPVLGIGKRKSSPRGLPAAAGCVWQLAPLCQVRFDRCPQFGQRPLPAISQPDRRLHRDSFGIAPPAPRLHRRRAWTCNTLDTYQGDIFEVVCIGFTQWTTLFCGSPPAMPVRGRALIAGNGRFTAQPSGALTIIQLQPVSRVAGVRQRRRRCAKAG